MKRQLYFVDVVWFLFCAVVIMVRVPAGPRFYAGMGLMAVSFTLWMAARFQLGRSFRATAQAHKLVTTGLYSKFRNPIYLFGQLAFLGLAIAWNTVLGYALFTLAIPLQMLRARKESTVLEKAFGDEYRAYRARTLF
ncbi:MAG: methyltransferase [Candidatus Sulfopaludibacter sp.]|nr:methyltransferase [Candidatus Sulfopaludibacter sp.]